jgi:Protein of unknown function (DUF3102)
MEPGWTPIRPGFVVPSPPSSGSNKMSSHIVADAEQFKVQQALIDAVRAAHEAILGATRNIVRQAIIAGTALIELKSAVPHGEWLPYLQRCGLKERTAQVYMRLADHRDVVEAKAQSSAHLSLSAALRFVAKPKAMTTAESNQLSEEQQLVDDIILEKFFAEAGGSDIFARIPAGRRADVVRGLLDALTVDGTLAYMSAEYGRDLRNRVPAPKAEPRKTINLTANSEPARGIDRKNSATAMKSMRTGRSFRKTCRGQDDAQIDGCRKDQ